MRLFVALDIPEAVRRRIAEFVTAMRRFAPGARWVHVEGAHLTLKFIGEAPPAQIEPIRRALEPVRAPAPLAIEFRDAGFFPDDRRPRVFWVGIDAPAALAQLAAEIESRLVPFGFPPESRPFRPHLTLARFDRPADSFGLRRALSEGEEHDFGAVLAREFYLYESRLGPAGARYTRLATFAFAP